MKSKIVIIILTVLCFITITSTICLKIYQHGYQVSLPSKIVRKIKKTTKIEITSNNEIVGTITDPEVIGDILNIIKKSHRTIKAGTTSTCEGSSLTLKFYNKKDELAESFTYFPSHKEAISPESLKGGCDNRYVIPADKSIKEIIKNPEKID